MKLFNDNNWRELPYLRIIEAIECDQYRIYQENQQLEKARKGARK